MSLGLCLLSQILRFAHELLKLLVTLVYVPELFPDFLLCFLISLSLCGFNSVPLNFSKAPLRRTACTQGFVGHLQLVLLSAPLLHVGQVSQALDTICH